MSSCGYTAVDINDLFLPCLFFTYDRYLFSRFIAIISGLEIGGKEDKLFALQLFVDMVIGLVGDMDQQQSSSSIVRVIVAGNSLSQDTQDKESSQKAKYLTKKSEAASVNAVKTLDDVFFQLAVSLLSFH